MKSQKQKILELLLDRFPEYATNFELNEICFRYGGRICDLRRDGWEIENKQVKENPQEWRARLLKPYKEKDGIRTNTESGQVWKRTEIFTQKQQAMKL